MTVHEVGQLNLPDFLAGPLIDRNAPPVHRADEDLASTHSDNAVPRGDRVNDAVDNDRRFLDTVGNVATLVYPGHLELAHIGFVDLVERAIAPRVIGAVILRPVVRVFVTGDRSLCPSYSCGK